MKTFLLLHGGEWQIMSGGIFDIAIGAINVKELWPQGHINYICLYPETNCFRLKSHLIFRFLIKHDNVFVCNLLRGVEV